MEVIGRVSYASQEPWVFSGTLRDNVLLGKTFEPDRYQSVLEACALDKVYTIILFSLVLLWCPDNFWSLVNGDILLFFGGYVTGGVF